MTIHHCPKCELRFEWKTELDDHCWHDHPEFQHDYPATHLPPEPVEPRHAAHKPAEPRHTHIGTDSLTRWLQPARPHHTEHEHQEPPQ
jgi:hypothetical protein